MKSLTITAAVEYGEGCGRRLVLNTPKGIKMAGCCFACDLGYEGDDCTCGAERIVVYLCNGALPLHAR
jgi:hypothetical protein